jgi:hypothetical protein
MNKAVTHLTPESEVTSDPLAKLREPFPANLISKLPKPYKKDSPKGKCAECGGYHGLPAVHLDYVGHAALTTRLLDVDPLWTWEPMGFAPDGTPAFDKIGGLWIKLTICGVSRLGYGTADGKQGGDAVKEVIGDALRNAAMRFGAALDLWHKGDLHAHEEEPAPSLEEKAIAHLRSCAIDPDTFKTAWETNKAGWKATLDTPAWARVIAEMKRLAGTFPKDEPAPSAPAAQAATPVAAAEDFGLADDEIPY